MSCINVSNNRKSDVYVLPIPSNPTNWGRFIDDFKDAASKMYEFDSLVRSLTSTLILEKIDTTQDLHDFIVNTIKFIVEIEGLTEKKSAKVDEAMGAAMRCLDIFKKLSIKVRPDEKKNIIDRDLLFEMDREELLWKTYVGWDLREEGNECSLLMLADSGSSMEHAFARFSSSSGKTWIVRPRDVIAATEGTYWRTTNRSCRRKYSIDTFKLPPEPTPRPDELDLNLGAAIDTRLADAKTNINLCGHNVYSRLTPEKMKDFTPGWWEIRDNDGIELLYDDPQGHVVVLVGIHNRSSQTVAICSGRVSHDHKHQLLKPGDAFSVTNFEESGRQLFLCNLRGDGLCCSKAKACCPNVKKTIGWRFHPWRLNKDWREYSERKNVWYDGNFSIVKTDLPAKNQKTFNIPIVTTLSTESADQTRYSDFLVNISWEKVTLKEYQSKGSKKTYQATLHAIAEIRDPE